MNNSNYSFEERFKGCLPLAHNELGTSKKRALRIMKEVEVLELNGYLQRRQQKMIDKSIQEAIYIATELGFLLSSNYDSQSDKFTFKSNPKLCSRLERKLPPTKEPPDLSSIIDEQMEWQLLHSFMF